MGKKHSSHHIKNCGARVSLLSKTVVSKEKSSHPPTNALSVVQDVELVNELIHAIAGLGDGAQIGHEAHIITLLQGGKKAKKLDRHSKQQHLIT